MSKCKKSNEKKNIKRVGGTKQELMDQKKSRWNKIRVDQEFSKSWCLTTLAQYLNCWALGIAPNFGYISRIFPIRILDLTSMVPCIRNLTLHVGYSQGCQIEIYFHSSSTLKLCLFGRIQYMKTCLAIHNPNMSKVSKLSVLFTQLLLYKYFI